MSTATAERPTARFSDAQYWDHFGSGYLRPEERPTPREAADHIIRLMVRIKEMEEEVKRAKHETKCAVQEFDTFAMEVSNLAHKRRPAWTSA